MRRGPATGSGDRARYQGLCLCLLGYLFLLIRTARASSKCQSDYGLGKG